MCVCVWPCLCVHVCVFLYVRVHHAKRRPERERVAVGEMTGFGCDLLSYALVIM